ncbi:MAG: aminotransferase class IV family protein [bacterium]
MCRFFETIRITDGRPEFLSRHESRMNQTRKVFGRELSFLSLSERINPPADLSEGLARCKVIYGKDIESIEYTAYHRKTIRSLMVVTCDDIDYGYKFLNRACLEALMATRGDCDDIIIMKRGFITDASMANLIFFDGKDWVTPKDPLFPGTCRARLLAEGVIKEKKIRLEEVIGFLGVKLINALRYPEESEMIPVEEIQKKSTFAKKKR